MSVYKDNATGKWRVIYRYTDITGKRKQTQSSHIFQLTGVGGWGLGMQPPTSSALCTHRAELALLIATLMEHQPALDGSHQRKEELLWKRMR